MEVSSGDGREGLAAAALPWLERDPVANNLLASLASGAISRDCPLFWGVVRDAGEIVAVAACAPPFPVALRATLPGAAAALARRFAAEGRPVARVGGTVAAADEFAAEWCARTGARPGLRSGLLLYRLDEVTPPLGVEGSARTAGPADRDLLLSWATAFLTEVELPGSSSPAGILDERLGRGLMAVWEVAGRPVAMAGTSVPIAGVARIGLVYTPPTERRRGYAGALVAEVSARALAGGARACMLYAESRNPTSNAVYKRIGYRLVTETVSIDLA